MGRFSVMEKRLFFDCRLVGNEQVRWRKMENSILKQRLHFGLGFVTFATLLLQLALVRVFDVILDPNMAYMVITSAMFALGLGGIYVYLFIRSNDRLLARLPLLALGYALSTVALLPAFNALPFDKNFSGGLLVQILSWGGMYILLILPFFLGGVIISVVFAKGSSQSHRLYFFDLAGAGLGCVLLVPLLPLLGPGGILFVVAASLVVAAFFLSTLPRWIILPTILAAVALASFPAVRAAVTGDPYLEFRGHGNKRNVDARIEAGLREMVYWDPVSKLDVFEHSPRAKDFQLDGGQQSSYLIAFDGDFNIFHREIEDNPDGYFFGLNSLPHWFMRDRDAHTLILGAAVGNETLAALVFGAEHVDSVELVGAMVDAAKGPYAEFSGNVFNDPRVNYVGGEGRTFLRSTDRKYDVIQMFSNHTSSSIAEGSGALAAAYLQTVEAYKEYFEHLTPDGLLSMNRHFYPRMLTTAAQAWAEMGWTDFPRHVLVFERWNADTLTTTLIKRTPWTEEEVNAVHDYMNRDPGRKSYPEPFLLSERILPGSPGTFEFISRVDRMDGLNVLLALPEEVPADNGLRLVLRDEDGAVVARGSVPAGEIEGNHLNEFLFDRPVENARNRDFSFELSVDGEADSGNAVAVFLTYDGRPTVEPVPLWREMYRIVFHPLRLDENFIPAELLAAPFPAEMTEGAKINVFPATDDRPFFNIVRKSVRKVRAGHSPFLDAGTAHVLNGQLLPFLSSDVLSFFVVGVLSLVFAFLLTFVPLLASRLGRAHWPQRGAWLTYFSCLGAGFILIELVLLQVFRKLIGFPTHTFATVLFALLFAAGAGSLLSGRLGLRTGRRWIWSFVGIFAYGSFFALTFEGLFSVGLEWGLPGRIIYSVLLLFPMGFFLGMPFPLGIERLGRLEPGGIPWAWGMNGFFTVFGGFATLLLAFILGFQNVLFVGLAIYLLAMLMFLRITKSAE